MVLDNLNTHDPAKLHDVLSRDDYGTVLQKVEFHFTPKHASWLDAAEIEISIVKKECLDRRIGDFTTFSQELLAWANRRNREGKKINWGFTKERAHNKFSRYYGKKLSW